jgi:hypothetical protein
MSKNDCEVNALRKTDCRLLQSKKLRSFFAAASKLYPMLHEIGRLREITFEGEGTNESIDLDKFPILPPFIPIRRC